MLNFVAETTTQIHFVIWENTFSSLNKYIVSIKGQHKATHAKLCHRNNNAAGAALIFSQFGTDLSLNVGFHVDLIVIGLLDCRIFH